MRDAASARAVQSSDAIQVLFIAGSGRSGSTLLERMIGAHDRFFCAGELRFVWDRSFRDDQLCGCGLPFSECPFWREVSRTAFGREPAEVDHDAVLELKQAVDRIRYVPWLCSSWRPAAFQSALAQYGELLTRFYSGIRQVSGTRVIVDSSKDPTQGFVLSALPNVRLDVVHLVRDPRAVAFSWTRSRERPEIHWRQELMPIERPATSARRWVLHNALSELLSRVATSYRRIRYEDFVARPDDALRVVMEPYGCPSDPHRTTGNVTLAPTHSVSGNPMRFSHGEVRLKLDDEWRSAMRPSDRRQVQAIAGAAMMRYGYRSWR
jgi:Sulfotransferase family